MLKPGDIILDRDTTIRIITTFPITIRQNGTAQLITFNDEDIQGLIRVDVITSDNKETNIRREDSIS